jgi:hypothetical protein
LVLSFRHQPASASTVGLARTLGVTPLIFMRARTVFIAALLVAAPGLLWQAFEMYGLTLGGAQMLFFSIVHTMPLAVVLVIVALPAGLVVLVQAAVGYLRQDYRERLGMTKPAARTLVMFLVGHFAALVGYGVWAPMDYVRMAICIVGIALLAAAAVHTALSLSNPVMPLRQSDA